MHRFTDSHTRRNALQLLGAIIVVVLFDAYGHAPTDDELATLAEEIEDSESWSSIPRDEVFAYFTALINPTGSSAGTESRSEIFAATSFIIAAFLVAARIQPEGVEWSDYLDRVEATIETEPERSY